MLLSNAKLRRRPRIYIPVAIARFAKDQGYAIAAEYVEVESAKGADALDRRPKLAAAIRTARKIKGRLSSLSWTASAAT